MRLPYELSSTVDDVENFTWESYDISLKKGSNKPEDLFFTTIFEAFEAKNKEPKESKVQENLVLLPASSFWLILYKEKYTVCLFFRLFSLFHRSEYKIFILQSSFEHILHCVDIGNLLYDGKLFATMMLPLPENGRNYGRFLLEHLTNKWQKGTHMDKYWKHKDAIFGRVSVYLLTK